MGMEGFHKSEFLERGNTWHVQPTGVSALEIISVILNRPERSSAQTREFNHDWVSGLVPVFGKIVLLQRLGALGFISVVLACNFLFIGVLLSLDLIGPLTGLTNENIRLLPCSDLRHNSSDVATFNENLQSQIVIAHVCQRIPRVVLTCVHHTLMFQEQLEDFVAVRSFESSQRFNKGDRDELVILHSHLNGRQHAEMVLGKVVN